MLDFSNDASVFLGDFGETITYTPHGVTPALSRTVVVERNPGSIGNKAQLQLTQHGGRSVAQGVIEIWIANHATLGVTSVKERFDKVSVPEKVGGSAKTYTVNKILDQDSGFWHLECGA